MSAIPAGDWRIWTPALALAAAAFRLGIDRGRQGWGVALLPLAVILPLAVAIARPLGLEPVHALLAAGLVIAILARDRNDLLQSECALKLAWVLGGSIALSWAGGELLAAVTGTRANVEQWAVLAVPVALADLWRVALPLSLLAGLVMLGGAPFHFWPADLFQGGRAWAAPLAAAALQITGAAWLARRLEGIEALPEARAVSTGVLVVAAGVALLVGAATLMQQRRPERRIGTLASLHGALALVMLIAHGAPGAAGSGDPGAAWFERWAAHLAIALTGAGLFSRFLPVATSEFEGQRGHGVLIHRHPFSTLAGLVACFSLAGVPGTPGSTLWFDAARALAATRHSGLLFLLGLAWLTAFSTMMQQWREAAGIPEPKAPRGSAVPLPARAALWIAAAGVASLAVAWALEPR